MNEVLPSGISPHDRCEGQIQDPSVLLTPHVWRSAQKFLQMQMSAESRVSIERVLGEAGIDAIKQLQAAVTEQNIGMLRDAFRLLIEQTHDLPTAKIISQIFGQEVLGVVDPKIRGHLELGNDFSI